MYRLRENKIIHMAPFTDKTFFLMARNVRVFFVFSKGCKMGNVDETDICVHLWLDLPSAAGQLQPWGK